VVFTTTFLLRPITPSLHHNAQASTVTTVETIQLDGATWATANDFYCSYLAAVGAPSWHGRNLDALWDSLTAGGINQRNLPFRIQISGTKRMSSDAREMVRRFEALVREAEQEGHVVEIELRT